MIICKLPSALFAEWQELLHATVVTCGGTDTEIRVSTESWFWRKKVSCRSYWDSNQTASYHESIALPLSYPAPTCVQFLLLSISQSKWDFRFYSVYFGHYRIKASHRQIWATRWLWQTDSVCLILKALMLKPCNLFKLFLFLCVCVCVCARMHMCALMRVYWTCLNLHFYIKKLVTHRNEEPPILNITSTPKALRRSATRNPGTGTWISDHLTKKRMEQSTYPKKCSLSVKLRSLGTSSKWLPKAVRWLHLHKQREYEGTVCRDTPIPMWNLSGNQLWQVVHHKHKQAHAHRG